MQGWTVGKKFLSAFAATFVLILSLIVLYVQQTHQSSQQLDQILHAVNTKLKIGNRIELAVTEMQGAQRGLMLSYAANDPASAPQYIELYNTSGKEIDSLLQQLEPLIASPAERAVFDSLRDSRTRWNPRFQELVLICHSGQIERAYTLRNQNKIISAAMHASSKLLVEEQERSLAAAQTRSSAAMTRSLWITSIAVAVSLGLGVLLFLLTRQITLSLRQTVDQLTEGARQLAEGAVHISSSSQIIADGTLQQADSIGETSSASEQISSMTQRNAENAIKASGLMHDTTSLVDEANQSLNQMQHSMNAMNESSAKVANIIKIIDQIAFQTNILALNAAVEAARAGDAGKGFAVVADEVRILAHRSAEAARDTTNLIEESLSKSEEGKAKLALVAASIRAITQSSTHVKVLVDEVKDGSAEQSKGIQLISTKMLLMEQFTQNAAASAEEGAATGQQLQAQANSLYGIVRSLHEMVG